MKKLEVTDEGESPEKVSSSRLFSVSCVGFNMTAC